MQENTKSVIVKMTARRCFRTEPIWQYDGGHVLTFEGFDLPAAFEVHFSRSPMGKAIPQIGTDGVCTVPEMFTQDAGVIYAWLYIADTDSRLTKYSIEIPVAKRAKPTDQQPTPVEQSAIDQAIAALNAGVERSETAADAAESAQEAAEGYAEAAGNSAITATNAASSAAAAKTAAETAARNAATSATDAHTSREAADQSVTNAGVSERAAASSASAAAGSATSAATSASQASGSATAASGSASTASAKASEAAQSATAAAGSAASASEDAGTASTAATAAEASATAAAGSATAAAGSATSAGQSATAAAGSASDAAGIKDYLDENYGEISEDVNSLMSAIDNGNVPLNKSVTWQNGYITTAGIINSSSLSGYCIVELQAGEIVHIGTNNNNITIIGSTTAESLSVGDTVNVIQTTSSVSKFEEYSYTAVSPIKIVLCVKLSNYTLDFEKEANFIKEIETKIDNVDDKIMQNYTISISDIQFTNGSYIKASDGTISENANFKYSDYIDVIEGSSIAYSLYGYNNIIDVIAAYKSNGDYVKGSSIYFDSSYSSGVTVKFEGTYTVPKDIKKIRVCNWATNQSSSDSISIPAKYSKIDKNVSDIEEIQGVLETFDVVNQWKNKKWVAFGTSITDNYSPNSYITQGEHTGEHTGKYVPYLLDMSELSQSAFVNRGISGGSINGHILYYIRYYTSDQADADLITIEGAVNDFATSVPLGQVGDTVPYTNSLLSDSTPDGTFAGACYQAFTTALTNAPNAVVVLLTETTGKNHVGYANYNQLRKNDLGLYQSDYIDMTMKVAEFVGIPVINCGRDSMINAQNPQYIADHIHHTYLGGYQYARTIWAKLKGIPLKALSVPS